MALTIAYVFLAALLLLVLVYSRLRLGLKFALVLVAGAFYWVSFQGWQNAQGWPSATALPERFLLHFVIVEEPDEREGTAGQFYVWATSLAGNQPYSTPRAHMLPYDKGLHVKFDAAMREMRNGNLQIGEVGGDLHDPAATRDNTRIADKKVDIEFTDLPDPQLPEK